MAGDGKLAQICPNWQKPCVFYVFRNFRAKNTVLFEFSFCSYFTNKKYTKKSFLFYKQNIFIALFANSSLSDEAKPKLAQIFKNPVFFCVFFRNFRAKITVLFEFSFCSCFANEKYTKN